MTATEEQLRSQLAEAERKLAEAEAPTVPRYISEWHEDIGPVLWWHPGEAPYCGSPLDAGHVVEMRHYVGGEGEVKTVNTFVGGWPGYHEWWTPLPHVDRAALNKEQG